MDPFRRSIAQRELPCELGEEVSPSKPSIWFAWLHVRTVQVVHHSAVITSVAMVGSMARFIMAAQGIIEEVFSHH